MKSKRTYLIRFMGSVSIEAESASEASDIFNGEFSGDEILDSILGLEIYGPDGEAIPWNSQKCDYCESGNQAYEKFLGVHMRDNKAELL